MRNVLIPRGSEQTANEGGGTEERQREEIRELKSRAGRKQDRLRTYDSAGLSGL